MKVSYRRWTEEELFASREEALHQWPTGREVDIDKAIEYRKTMPVSRIAASKYVAAKEKGELLALARAGVVPIEVMIDYLRHLEAAGADLLGVNGDTYSRELNYGKAEEQIQESIRMGHSMLNGFPPVVYGVKACRRLIEAVDVPLCGRGLSDRDPRLAGEIYLAAGFTYYINGCVNRNVACQKDIPIDVSIRNTQHVDRLASLYEERGAPMIMENYGTLTGTLVPPSIAISVLVIQGLLAAEQGVKRIVSQFGQCGCLAQDVAALRVLDKLLPDYLHRHDHHDVLAMTGFGQWMGAFPKDPAQALGLIALGAATAVLGGATLCTTKSSQEMRGIPTKEANADGIKATKQVFRTLGKQRLPESEILAEEMEEIELETRAIVDRALELGDGDLATGTTKAFEAGTLDIPWSPSKYNKGKVISAKDHLGAVRFFDHGDLPFTDRIVQFNRKRLEQRARLEGSKVTYDMVIKDVFSLSEEVSKAR